MLFHPHMNKRIYKRRLKHGKLADDTQTVGDPMEDQSVEVQ